MTVAETARRLGVSRSTLSRLLNGQSRLSDSMALRIERAFGVRGATMMKMQYSYDLSRRRDTNRT
jgi:addiction module antidote protein, HigA family